MGWLDGWRKVEAREPWRGIPELEGVGRTRACDVYERAVERVWHDWRAVRVVCLSVLGWVGWSILFRYSGRIMLAFFGRDYWMGWTVTFQILVFVGAGVGWHRLAGRMYVAQLRRLVRGELGTHCRGCDYDLRGTPDLRPPGVTRCPECGRVVPRNVHRVVPVPRGSGVGEGVSREV